MKRTNIGGFLYCEKKGLKTFESHVIKTKR